MTLGNSAIKIMCRHCYSIIETMDIELIYFNQQPIHTLPTNRTANSTLNAEDVTHEIYLYRAVMGFLLVILLYFCLVCHVWREETVETKPEVIDRSLVKKVSV